MTKETTITIAFVKSLTGSLRPWSAKCKVLEVYFIPYLQYYVFTVHALNISEWESPT